uniref:Putative transposase (Putative), gypsy type n=1 Tax=Tanacetum cinerariifolium TaxID=118510 RepID=A0A6L2K5M4_TANCI|nr:putative transposase (putative), gypsy type [Tanacetum cinerariifolium]
MKHPTDSLPVAATLGTVDDDVTGIPMVQDDYYKQEAGEEYPAVLYQALGLSQKLEQPLFLGGREGVPDCRGLANECSKRWDAGREHSAEAVRILDAHRTPIQKQPEVLLCLVGISRIYYPGDEVYRPVQFNPCSNPTKVKTRSRPRAAHEVPLLTVTATRVIEMEDPTAATDSSGVLSTIKRSPLDFATEAGAEGQGTMALEVPPPEDVPTTRGVPEAGQAERVAATDPPAVGESLKRGHDGVDANAPSKALRRDHADPRPTGSTCRGKSLAAIELGMGSTIPTPVPESTPADVSDPDPLSFADPRSRHPADIAQSSQGTDAAGDPESENTSFASAIGFPESIYRPEWGIANGRMLDTPEACQDLVDHVALPGYFSELCHLLNDDFLRQYNVNLARQVAMGSQLRLRFEQEAKRLKKSVAQVARRDKRIQDREHEIKNMDALLEAEADMKKAAEDKSAKLSQELENMRTLFSDLQYEDNRVEQRCAEMDARLDALSIDFDEELYPHMLTAIACRRWMIGHGLRLAVVKWSESLELRHTFADVVSAGIAKGMSEGLRHGVEHGQAQLNLESIETYDPEAKAKYIVALQALKNLKYPLVDQLEGLKDAPMDVIMAALLLESDTRDDAPQWVHELHPKMLLADAIAANVSRAEKKKKCRIVCRTDGVDFAHHARSGGVLVSAPTVIPKGLAILLADATTQTESDDVTLNNL